MARIRTIKPEFWIDEDICSLQYESRLMAIALLNYADDEGYFRANNMLVKAACFPLDDDSTIVRRTLEQLQKIEYIELFEGIDGKQYGKINNFLKHQRVDRPKDSEIKGLYDSTNIRRTFDEESPQERKGKEGKGKEGIEGENNAEKEKTFKNVPYQEIVSCYHEILPMLPRVVKLTSKRQRQIKTLWNDEEHGLPDTQSWKNFFTFVSRSNFLTGKVVNGNKKPFLADIEWLTNYNNFIKISEDKYHGKVSR